MKIAQKVCFSVSRFVFTFVIHVKRPYFLFRSFFLLDRQQKRRLESFLDDGRFVRYNLFN